MNKNVLGSAIMLTLSLHMESWLRQIADGHRPRTSLCYGVGRELNLAA